MRKLLLLLIPSLLFAQKYDPRTAPDKLDAKQRGHYGSFSITTIPKVCAHPHSLFGVKTCRVHVRYPSVVPKPIFFIEDWTGDGDHSKSEDTIYHVALYKPDAQGVYIEGIPGHRIWWQVNSR